MIEWHTIHFTVGFSSVDATSSRLSDTDVDSVKPVEHDTSIRGVYDN